MINTLCNLIRKQVADLTARGEIDGTLASEVTSLVNNISPVKVSSEPGNIKSKVRITMKKPTKTECICYVLSLTGIPMSRVEILKEVHRLEESQIEFTETSNRCYFSPRHERQRKDSLLENGLIQVHGKRGNTLLYTLAPGAEMFALRYAHKRFGTKHLSYI